MTRLCQLAEKWKTDKVPSLGHSYTPYYDELFKDRDVKKLLEIGIGFDSCWDGYQPGASLRMWEEYFPKAEIYGLDIRSDVLVNSGRIQSLQCDQGDYKAWDRVLKELRKDFDIIIDDGSHRPDHQLLSALVLLPSLAADGIYIIEDVAHPELVAPFLEGCEVKTFPANPNIITGDDCLIVIRKAA